MTKEKQNKYGEINCVQLQRQIRNKMFEESQNKSLEDMVEQIKKGLKRNNIWKSLEPRGVTPAKRTHI
jgi:hypothetical protein